MSPTMPSTTRPSWCAPVYLHPPTLLPSKPALTPKSQVSARAVSLFSSSQAAPPQFTPVTKSPVVRLSSQMRTNFEELGRAREILVASGNVAARAPLGTLLLETLPLTLQAYCASKKQPPQDVARALVQFQRFVCARPGAPQTRVQYVAPVAAPGGQTSQQLEEDIDVS
jgi:hypothetical protein